MYLVAPSSTKTVRDVNASQPSTKRPSSKPKLPVWPLVMRTAMFSIMAIVAIA